MGLKPHKGWEQQQLWGSVASPAQLVMLTVGTRLPPLKWPGTVCLLHV